MNVREEVDDVCASETYARRHARIILRHKLIARCHRRRNDVTSRRPPGAHAHRSRFCPRAFVCSRCVKAAQLCCAYQRVRRQRVERQRGAPR